MSKLSEKLWSRSPWTDVDKFRDDYHRSGVSGEPADRATTEAIITKFYRRARLSDPTFLWFDGPIACHLAVKALDRAGLRQRLGVELDLDHRLWGSLRADLDRQIEAELGDDPVLWSHLDGGGWFGDQALAFATAEDARSGMFAEADVGMRLGRLISFHLDRELHDLNELERWSDLGVDYWLRFDAQLRDRVGIGFQGPVDRRWVGWSPGGFFSGLRQAWVAHYLGYEYLGIAFDAQSRAWLADWDTLNRAAGWWLPFARSVICSERLLVHLDSDGRLHNERGSALECRDGYSLRHHHHWHGVHVPAEWIEAPGTLSPWTALRWPNLEQRRVAAEILGWANVFARVPTRVVEADGDPEIGTLVECDIPDEGPARFLRVRCGTGRDFAIRVPREMTTARQANAWTYGLQGDEYRLEART